MESNTTNEQYFATESPLTEPHFIEEATVLSARPVVPLEEIQSEERSRKRLLFGLAIACSLALGALTAMLFYRNSGQQAPVEITQAAPGAAGITIDAPVAAIAESVDAAASGVSPNDTETAAPPVSKKPSPAAARNSLVVVKKSITPTPPQEEESAGNWDERFNERRRRRISERGAKRESRRRQRRSADDLLRIRDIFEGPPRP